MELVHFPSEADARAEDSVQQKVPCNPGAVNSGLAKMGFVTR